jgi:hypothetical protein
MSFLQTFQKNQIPPTATRVAKEDRRFRRSSSAVRMSSARWKVRATAPTLPASKRVRTHTHTVITHTLCMCQQQTPFLSREVCWSVWPSSVSPSNKTYCSHTGLQFVSLTSFINITEDGCLCCCMTLHSPSTDTAEGPPLNFHTTSATNKQPSNRCGL